MLGLATAAVAEAVRPRGGTTLLLDWEAVRRMARARLENPTLDRAQLASAAMGYRSLADKLEKPLLNFIGGLPKGASIPQFEAIDREGWVDLNLTILRRAVDPVLEAGRMPNSLIVEVGKAGVDRYVGAMLAFLGRRVLGQYDPQLMAAEPMGGEGLYLVETNVVDWQRHANLPEEDLRRWLILHEMTHAWQFAAHPWLREHLDRHVQELVSLTSRSASSRGVDRLRALTVGVPSQWDLVRRLQATMTLVEGHGNLVMNLVGRRLLPSFERLEQAYRARSGERGMLEQLVWRVTGLEMKMEQYRVGERFAAAIHDQYGMAVLNRAWESAETLPRSDELEHPERWYRRVGRASSA